MRALFSRSPTLILRIICLLCCIPSGGALLAKVYGVAQMQPVTLFVFVPCALIMVVVWQWAKRNQRQLLADAMRIGFLGGLLGTLGYDLIRVPFMLAGQRVFAPISAYGVWVADASLSSRWTELIGWTYHFSNGITFGIMYALFMKNRHWGWGIVWGFVLETIAVLSPFATIFALTGNYRALGIAYLGHVAYGLPLGWVVYRWDETAAWLDELPRFFIGVGWAIAFVVAGGVAFSAENITRNNAAQPITFQIDADTLNPDWLRIDRGDTITVNNRSTTQQTIRDVKRSTSYPLASGEQTALTFTETGIYQLFVEVEGRTRSSFVIVEPVESLSP